VIEVDDLSAVLDVVRMRGQMYCRLEARVPWGMRGAPSPIATFHGVVEGDAVLQIPGEPDLRLTSGDLAVLCHGSGHSISDEAGRPSVPILDLIGSSGSWLVRCGGRGARTVIVCGGFAAKRDGPPLLSLMPAVLCLRGNPRVENLLQLLASEGGARSPGSDALVARLTEALFVEVARAGMAGRDGQQGEWIAALRDSRIASSLAAIHKEPSREWTVHELARRAGMSRSAFALTFAQLVHEPPLAYVARWRLYSAKVLLRESAHGIAEIASRVGYESEASLSKAFRRQFGVAPGAYRRSVQ